MPIKSIDNMIEASLDIPVTSDTTGITYFD